MGEGFKFTLAMVTGFVLISLASILMIAAGKADVAMLKELFISLGILAALFGIPQAVQAWIQTRGQTAEISAVAGVPVAEVSTDAKV